MAHTNQTPHFDLPQFLGTDKASWLGDINPAMLAIDTALFQVKTDASDAASSSAAAQQSAQAAETAAELAQSQSEENTTQLAALKTTVDSQQVQLGTLSSGQTSQGAEITTIKTDVTQLQTDVQNAEQLANAAQQTATAADTKAQNAQTQLTATNNALTELTNRVNKIDTQSLIVPSQLYSAWPICLMLTWDSSQLYVQFLGSFIAQGNYFANANGPYTTLSLSFNLHQLNFPFANTLVQKVQASHPFGSISTITTSNGVVTAGTSILNVNSTTVIGALSGTTLTVKITPSYSTNPVRTQLYLVTGF